MSSRCTPLSVSTLAVTMSQTQPGSEPLPSWPTFDKTRLFSTFDEDGKSRLQIKCNCTESLPGPTLGTNRGPLLSIIAQKLVEEGEFTSLCTLTEGASLLSSIGEPLNRTRTPCSTFVGLDGKVSTTR